MFATATAETELCWSHRSVWLDHWHLDASQRGELNIPLCYSPPQGTTCTNLDVAVEGLVHRHEIFRSTFPYDADRGPVQRVHAAGTLAVDRREIGTGGQAAVDDELEEFGRAPFAIEAEPPIRARTVTSFGRPVALLLVIHHIAADDWSNNQVKRELDAVLTALRDRRPVSLPPVARQPAEQAGQESGPAGLSARRRTIEHWTSTAAAAPTDMYPFRSPPPQGGPPTSDAALVSVAALSAARRLAGRYWTWPAVIFLSAFNAVLSGCTGNRVVASKILSANREPTQMSDVVCCGFLPVLMAVDCGPDLDFEEVVRRTEAAGTAALANGHGPYDGALEILARSGAAHGAPFRARTVFNYLNYAPRAHGRPDAGFSWREPIWSHTPEDVYFRVHEYRDCAVVECNARRNVLPPADNERLLRAFEELLIQQASAREVHLTEVDRWGGFPDRYTDPTRWRYLDHTWVDLSATARCLRESGAVGDVDLEVDLDRQGRPRLVAHVTGCGGRPDPGSLRLYALGRLDRHPGARCPDVVLVHPAEPSDGTVPRASTQRPVIAEAGRQRSRPLRPGTVAEEMLCEFIRETSERQPRTTPPPRDGIDLADSYVTAGGRVLLLPELLHRLRARGLRPPPLHEFCGVRPLVHLAEDMSSGAPLTVRRDPEVV